MKQLRLKEYRKKAKMTQFEVANAINVSQSYYSRLELGKSFPDSKQIIKLCNTFSCTPNDLFGIHGAMEVAFGQFFEDEE